MDWKPSRSIPTSFPVDSRLVPDSFPVPFAMLLMKRWDPGDVHLVPLPQERIDAMKSKSQPNGKLKRYVTIQDAADLLNIAERTVFRMIEDKRLESMKDSNGSRWVALDDIEGKQQAKLHSESPVRHQLKQAQALIAELQDTVRNQDARLQAQDSRLHLLEQELAALVSQEVPIIQLPPQEGASTFSLAEITQLVTKQVVANLHLSPHTPQGVAGMIAKRNLPVGTMRLVDFAHQHEISVHAIKKGYYELAFALTVHQRAGTVKRNHQEWWITQEQHQPVIAYCQQQAIPYVPCPQCQDQGETDAQVG
jgi:excisionase family DNA binding protein